MKKVSTFLFLLFTTLFFGQEKKEQPLIDSLLVELSKRNTDTLKAHLAFRIAKSYSSIDSKKSKQFCLLGEAIAKKINWKKGLGIAIVTKSDFFFYQNDFNNSLSYYKRAQVIFKKIKYKKGILETLTNIGVTYQRLGNYTNASYFYFEALKQNDSIQNKEQLARIYSNLSALYFIQNNLKKSLQYNYKAYEIYKKRNDFDGIANSYESIGNIYSSQGEFKKAQENYFFSINFYKKNNNSHGIATIYSQLGTAYNTDYNKKLYYYFKAKEIWDKINPKHYTAILNIGNIGCTYLDIVRYDTLHKTIPNDKIPIGNEKLLKEALIYIKKSIALSKEINDIDDASYFTGVLAEAQAEIKDYKGAYLNFRIYQDVQDSIFSQANKNKIAQMESQKMLDLKNQEIKINNLKLESKKKQILLLVAGLFLLGIIGGLLFYQNRSRKKSNQKLKFLNLELDKKNEILDKSNKNKILFFNILNHDLRSPLSNLIAFLNIQKNNPSFLDNETKFRIQETTYSSVENLLSSMDDILLWSKGQLDHFRPVFESVSIELVFLEIKNYFLSEKKIKFVFENQKKVLINTDINYFKTITRNLTSNAIKALELVEEPIITWKVWQNQNKTFLAICDNGKGINQEKIKAFYNEKEITSIKSGLGLYLVKDLASIINCEIMFESEINKGTKIILAFE